MEGAGTWRRVQATCVDERRGPSEQLLADGLGGPEGHPEQDAEAVGRDVDDAARFAGNRR